MATWKPGMKCAASAANSDAATSAMSGAGTFFWMRGIPMSMPSVTAPTASSQPDAVACAASISFQRST